MRIHSVDRSTGVRAALRGIAITGALMAVLAMV